MRYQVSSAVLLSLAALSLTTLPAQTITLAEGTPTSLRISTVAESDPNGAETVVLQDAELLPIEMTGRTLAHELDPSRSRRIERNGIVRLELPGGGRLFRYRRAGGLFWGFLHVAVDGTPRIVLESAGTGGQQTADPFLDRIAIADDGRHAAISRNGGGLRIVRLDGGVFTGSGRSDWIVGNTIDPIATSVMIGPSHVFYQADGAGNQLRLWRCSLAEGSVPDDVSPPAVANGDFKDQMVLSRDGSRLVCLYGLQQQGQVQQQLWQVGLTGPASVLPPVASKYEEPGYLPEDRGEPAMLLNDDGSRLFFVEADVRDELFLLDMAGQMPALQITEDAIFQPYLGVHILPKFAGTSLLVAVGDPAGMDWYRAALAPAGGSVVNLTGTGSLVQPFVEGALDPVHAADIGGTLLITEHQAGTMNLRRIDPLSGVQTIVHTNLLAPPQSGSGSVGTADLLVQGALGDSLFSGVNGNLLVTLPAGLLLTPPVQGPLFTGTWLHLPIQLGVPMFYAPAGIVTLPLEFDLRQLSMTAVGGVVLVGDPVRYLALGTYVVMNRPLVPFRAVLSGAGG